MKFICEMTKDDFESCDILDYSVNELRDKISDPNELIEEIENNIDNYCFSDLTFTYADTEVKIDGLSVEDFLEKNKNEIWEVFEAEYPEMIEKETTEVNCCYNCLKRSTPDQYGNFFCSLRKKEVKPNEYCEEGEFKN